MKLDTIECSFRDNIELNQVVTEEILSQGSKIRIDIQTLLDDLRSCRGTSINETVGVSACGKMLKYRFQMTSDPVAEHK